MTSGSCGAACAHFRNCAPADGTEPREHDGLDDLRRPTTDGPSFQAELSSTAAETVAHRDPRAHRPARRRRHPHPGPPPRRRPRADGRTRPGEPSRATAETDRPWHCPACTVVVDWTTLTGETWGRIDGDYTGTLHPSDVERLLCDCTVSRVVTGPDGLPLDVGRSRRTIPPQLRRALAVRDHGCRYPGCDPTPRLDPRPPRHPLEPRRHHRPHQPRVAVRPPPSRRAPAGLDREVRRPHLHRLPTRRHRSHLTATRRGNDTGPGGRGREGIRAIATKPVRLVGSRPMRSLRVLVAVVAHRAARRRVLPAARLRAAGRPAGRAPALGPVAHRRVGPRREPPRRELREEVPADLAGRGRLRRRRRRVPPRPGLQRRAARRGVRLGDAPARRDRPGLRRLDRVDGAASSRTRTSSRCSTSTRTATGRSCTATASPSGRRSPTACRTRTTPFPTYYLTNPALQRAFDNFWLNKPGPDGVPLQTHYAEAVHAVAASVHDEDYVLGYDTFNEPWPGADLRRRASRRGARTSSRRGWCRSASA